MFSPECLSSAKDFAVEMINEYRQKTDRRQINNFDLDLGPEQLKILSQHLEAMGIPPEYWFFGVLRKLEGISLANQCLVTAKTMDTFGQFSNWRRLNQSEAEEVKDISKVEKNTQPCYNMLEHIRCRLGINSWMELFMLSGETTFFPYSIRWFSTGSMLVTNSMVCCDLDFYREYYARISQLAAGTYNMEEILPSIPDMEMQHLWYSKVKELSKYSLSL